MVYSECCVTNIRFTQISYDSCLFFLCRCLASHRSLSQYSLCRDRLVRQCRVRITYPSLENFSISVTINWLSSFGWLKNGLWLVLKF